MSEENSEPKEMYESIEPEIPSWADDRYREISEEEYNEVDNDDEEDTEEYNAGFCLDDFEVDDDSIWRDLGTGSRSSKADNYEREYRDFTNQQIWEYANQAVPNSTSCLTRFDLDDVPEDRKKKFRRLDKHNRGVREDWWREYREWLETLKDARHFAGRLGLLGYQVQEVAMYTRKLDFQGGRRKEHLILALITLVSDKYTKDIDNKVSDTTMFDSFLGSVHMDKGDLMSVRQDVREQIPEL